VRKIESPAKIVQGKLFLAHRENFMSQISSLDDCQGMLTFEKNKKKASKDQFGWLYGDIYPQIINRRVELGNTDILNNEDLDAYFKIKFTGREVVNIHTGEIIRIPKLKREFSTLEMCTFIEQILENTFEDLDLFVHPPDSNWKENALRNQTNEIELNL
jgi:hypothetical protein